jgi:glycosyltransferase involved in cell wall biosynthesis
VVPAARPPRVLVWFWGTGGAGVRYTYRFASEIAAHVGHENVSVSVHEANAMIDLFRADGIAVHVVEGAAGYREIVALMLSAPGRFWRFMSQLKQVKPDIVVLPMNFALAWPFNTIARVMGCQVLYTVHDAMPHPGDYARPFQLFTQNRLLASASQLIALSSYVGENLRDDVSRALRDTLKVVPLSTHVLKRRQSARPYPVRPVRLLCLGRLLKYKGHEMLAAALEPLKGRKDWVLTIAGNGPEREDIIALFGKFQQVDLSNLRFLLESEVDALIASHDIAVCPHEEASQSGFLAEAQAEALPAVVTPVGALPEQVAHGKAGWIAATATPADLTAALTSAIDDVVSYSLKSAGALAMTSATVGSTAWGPIIKDMAARRKRA